MIKPSLVKYDKYYNFNIYIKAHNSITNNKICAGLYVENILICRIYSADSLKYDELDHKIGTYLDMNTIDLFKDKFKDWFIKDTVADDEESEEYLSKCPISELFDIYMDYVFSYFYSLDYIQHKDNVMCPIMIGFSLSYIVDDNYKFDKGEFDMVSDRVKNHVDSNLLSDYSINDNILKLSFYWKFNSYKEVSDFLE